MRLLLVVGLILLAALLPMAAFVPASLVFSPHVSATRFAALAESDTAPAALLALRPLRAPPLR